jgi:hypothetical protein
VLLGSFTIVLKRISLMGCADENSRLALAAERRMPALPQAT